MSHLKVKLGILAALSYTLDLCSIKGKNPLQKHYCVTQHCQHPCTKFTGIQLTWQIGQFKNELWLWSCLLKQSQLQQCSNISNDNFIQISLIITIAGQHGVKKDLQGLRTMFHLYAWKERILWSPCLSAPQHVLATGIKVRTVHQMLHCYLHYHPLKIQTVQNLCEWDKACHVQFCNQGNARILMHYWCHLKLIFISWFM